MVNVNHMQCKQQQQQSDSLLDQSSSNCRLLVALVVCLFVGVAVSSKGADLLFQKKISDGPVVGKELDISFIIYNVGEGAAYDISFADTDFGASADFEVVKGQSSGKWEVIEPNTNVSQTITITPSKGGVFPLTSTILEYRKSQNEELSHTSAASYTGMYVESVEEFDKRTSLHLKEWGTFILLSFGSVAFPFALWSYYKVNYENGIKKNK
ncbi:translocon-associated protein subunit beta [Cavenderia fasciculata]|uniref:Translocon-associated protein subunit beta n=1 Tax=Cavenderia fasciculata TaxID=261658 RepID=F4QBU1_CACFS|nr:translocon-associated protein subunit beta [Cavenderia fasciculata]EGG14679.1 translocon-associated protein subunit beta [Cavenderia fasciculata]|eukprot:XP_004351187.1 translocon-associated protein subunit beta [Cavenderia fasciculata]